MTWFKDIRGYYGSVEYCSDNGLFRGVLVGMRDYIAYEGPDIGSLRRNFVNAVDGYIWRCEQVGKTPERSFQNSLQRFSVHIRLTA